jgi:hypothetical protein
LALILVTGFLIIGTCLLPARPAAAKIIFGASGIVGILVLTQWRPLVFVTCTLLAILACIVSVRRQRAMIGNAQ